MQFPVSSLISRSTRLRYLSIPTKFPGQASRSLLQLRRTQSMRRMTCTMWQRVPGLALTRSSPARTGISTSRIRISHPFKQRNILLFFEKLHSKTAAPLLSGRILETGTGNHLCLNRSGAPPLVIPSREDAQWYRPIFPIPHGVSLPGISRSGYPFPKLQDLFSVAQQGVP